MNERIKLMAIESGFDEHQSKFDTRIEKFAELLLQECINICEDLGDKGMDGHYCVDKISRTFKRENKDE